MVLSDASFNSFAVAIAASAGAFLAISATLWIFLFDRRAQDESQALRSTRTAADAMYRFLVANATVQGNYLNVLPTYTDLFDFVTRMTFPLSVDTIPSYLEWREHTAEITRSSVAEGATLHEEAERVLRNEPIPTLDSERRKFHTDFVMLMFELDLAVQDIDWARGNRRQGVRYAETDLGIAIFLVVGSLTMALFSGAQTARGVSDDWNWVLAALLLANLGILLVFLLRTFNASNVSRGEWIEARIREKAKALTRDATRQGS